MFNLFAIDRKKYHKKSYGYLKIDFISIRGVNFKNVQEIETPRWPFQIVILSFIAKPMGLKVFSVSFILRKILKMFRKIERLFQMVKIRKFIKTYVIVFSNVLFFLLNFRYAEKATQIQINLPLCKV